MVDLSIKSPVKGLDASQSANLIDDRACVGGSINVDLKDGVVTAPYGFSKLSDLPESGEMLLGLCSYKEVNGRVNLVAATNTKIHQHNPGNDVWDELSGDTIDADVFHPVSFASVYHQTAVGGKNQHLVISDGGRSEIIRWPGNGLNLAELAGGDDYNAGGETGHRALQVIAYHERCILISPYTYDGTNWVFNQSQVRYPQIGELESWAGTGSGTHELVDTGDYNVRAELLGAVLAVYQSHSIWQYRWVGGTTVFVPDVIIPSLGLLSYHLLVSAGNVHFFVGNDYNIYQYSTGNLRRISDDISDLLKNDLNTSMTYGCRMALDAQKRHLWIFIVTGTEQAVIAYRYNLLNEAWSVRDLSNYYTSGGVTAAVLLEAGVYAVGDSYADAVADETTYAAAVTAATTYADTLTEMRMEERLTIGDDNGYVLQEDFDTTEDDGTEPTHYFITKEFDGGVPDISKRIDGIMVDAKYPDICSSGTLTIEYKIDDGSWTALTSITLGSTFTPTKRYINRTGKKIQFRFSGQYTLRSFSVFNVQIEERR